MKVYNALQLEDRTRNEQCLIQILMVFSINTAIEVTHLETAE